jgi:hypothetical protein
VHTTATTVDGHTPLRESAGCKELADFTKPAKISQEASEAYSTCARLSGVHAIYAVDFNESLFTTLRFSFSSGSRYWRVVSKSL